MVMMMLTEGRLNQIFFFFHLDAREGDSRGGIGANHQGDEGGTQVPEHVWQLVKETDSWHSKHLS